MWVEGLIDNTPQEGMAGPGGALRNPYALHTCPAVPAPQVPPVSPEATSVHTHRHVDMRLPLKRHGTQSSWPDFPGPERPGPSHGALAARGLSLPVSQPRTPGGPAEALAPASTCRLPKSAGNGRNNETDLAEPGHTPGSEVMAA